MRQSIAERDAETPQPSEPQRFYEPFEPESVVERDAATAATTLLLAERGVHIFRVHNILRNKVALQFANALAVSAQSAGVPRQ